MRWREKRQDGSSEKPVAMLSGTPLDTKMGADVLEVHGIVSAMYPVSAGPLEQTFFQVKSPEEKREALLLGCTHFPYIRQALTACTDLPLIDPAEEMVEILLR